MEEGIDWMTVKHDSRKKTALSESGLMKLADGLKNGLLTGGEPVTVDIAEIRRNALLSEMPTEDGADQRTEDGRLRTEDGGQTAAETDSEKKPRAVIGLLPAPFGCECGPAIEAVLIVYRHPDTVPNKRTLLCKLKPGQMPPHHEKAVTDGHGTAYCRVKCTEKFLVGMEVPARFEGGNVWSIARPCPRRKGKW